MYIDSYRLFVIPFDPELLSILKRKKETFGNTVQKQNTIFNRDMVIENKGLFFKLREKKREMSTKFQVKLEFNLQESPKNTKGKSVSKPIIFFESLNQENLIICFEYILKLKDNFKIKYYNPARYGSLIKNKFSDIKNRIKSNDIIIDLYLPKNDQGSMSLFATSAANDAKTFVETFFKSFEFKTIKRNFDENSYNLIKEKLNEIEDQANIKIISLNNVDSLEFIGDTKDIETADQIVKNILSDNKTVMKMIYPKSNRILTMNFLKHSKKTLKNGDLNLLFNTSDVEYELIEQYDALRYQCKSTNLQETMEKLVKKLEEIGSKLSKKAVQIEPNIFRYLKETPSLITEVEEKHQVQFFLPDQELKPVILLCNKLANVQVYICNGNIINAGTDVIVNTVNCNMDGNSGVAKAIYDAAGSEFASECRLIPKPLKTTEYYETTAGKLCSERIINIIAPIYNSTSQVDELIKLYINLIYKCIKLGYSSIAVPLLGAGVYNWPIKEAIKALMNAINLIIFSTCLRKIYLVEYDDEAMKSIIKAVALDILSFQNLEIISSTVKIEQQNKKIWYWLDDDQQWKQYRSDINAKINNNLEAKTTRFMISFDSKSFIIDTERKTQLNMNSRLERPISDSVPQIRVGQWFWIDKKYEVAYNIKNNAEIEDAFLKGLAVARICLKRHSDDKDCYYIIDFLKMTQTNENTRYTRKVVRNVSIQNALVIVEDENDNDEFENIDGFCIDIRIGGESDRVNVAINYLTMMIKNLKVSDMIKDCDISNIPSNIWKENKFKIISPGNYEKQFVKIFQKGNNVLFESQIKTDMIEIKEQVYKLLLRAKSFQSTIKYPLEWTDVLSNNLLRSVVKGTKEWIDIETKFNKTLEKKTILDIKRIQNKSIWKTYYDERLYIEGKREKLNEIFLWHGTRNTKPECIYEGIFLICTCMKI